MAELIYGEKVQVRNSEGRTVTAETFNNTEWMLWKEADGSWSVGVMVTSHTGSEYLEEGWNWGCEAPARRYVSDLTAGSDTSWVA